MCYNHRKIFHWFATYRVKGGGNMDDRELIALLWRRSEDALAALSQRFCQRLQRLAQNILPNEADAQECVNDTYLALWNTIPPNRPLSLSAYVYRLCKNIAVSRLRAIHAQKRSGYEIALDELSEAIGTNSLEQQLEARELGNAIDRFLETLSKENRVIFLRRYWQGDQVKDIAKQLALTESSVSARLSRMRQNLKLYLTKEGLL